MLKRSLVLFVVAAFLPFAAFADAASDATITGAEYAELIKQIEDNQDRLLGLISGLSDEQWNFKQNPDRWSVGECTEHIVRSQRSILDLVKQVLASPRDPEWATKTAGKTAIVRQVVPSRGPQGQGGVQAPAEIRPTEHWDRAHAIREFYAAQGEVRAYVETMDRAIKDHTMQHPVPALGWMNGYDWLNLLTMHTVRHSKQIVEVQEDPNYPKGGATTGAR
jgi:hypothetical protein